MSLAWHYYDYPRTANILSRTFVDEYPNRRYICKCHWLPSKRAAWLSLSHSRYLSLPLSLAQTRYPPDSLQLITFNTLFGLVWFWLFMCFSFLPPLSLPRPAALLSFDRFRSNYLPFVCRSCVCDCAADLSLQPSHCVVCNVLWQWPRVLAKLLPLAFLSLNLRLFHWLTCFFFSSSFSFLFLFVCHYIATLYSCVYVCV